MTKIRLVHRLAACLLLLMEATYFLWIAYATGAPFLGASLGVPPFVIVDGAAGALLAAAALGYMWQQQVVVRIVSMLWPAFLLYGLWSFSNSYRIMARWGGAFEGDLVALSTASGAGFVLLALVLCAERLVARRAR